MSLDAFRLYLFKFSSLSSEHEGTLVALFEDITIVLIARGVADATASPQVDGTFILH